MASDILKEHQERVKNRSRGAWLDYVGASRIREGVAYAFAVLMGIAAIIAISLAHHTASSVIVQNDVREVDRLGQTLGQSGSIYRIPAALETHAFLSDFITDIFSVFASGPAMQRNYAVAQAYVDGQSPVGGILKEFWDGYSPLRPDQTWDRTREQERVVSVTSILDRGRWSGSAEEYEIEWTVSPLQGDGHIGNPTLYKGDIAVVGGAQRSDANPWGLLVTHFSWSILR
jgi:type IV secretory pathway TrbF-like protein